MTVLALTFWILSLSVRSLTHQCARLEAVAALTPATALALPPLLLAFATALADAELELPRQSRTVGALATAAEKASAVPELCASAAASAHGRHHSDLEAIWRLIAEAACVSCQGGRT